MASLQHITVRRVKAKAANEPELLEAGVDVAREGGHRAEQYCDEPVELDLHGALDGVLVGEGLEMVVCHQEERQGASDGYALVVGNNAVRKEVVGLQVTLHLAVEVPQGVHGEVEGVLFGVHQSIFAVLGEVAIRLGVEAKSFLDSLEEVTVSLRWAV